MREIGQEPHLQQFRRLLIAGTSSVPVVPVFPSRRTYKVNDTALGLPLLGRDRLRVGFQCDPTGCVAEQFLHDLYVGMVGAQQSGIRVAKGVPSEWSGDVSL